MHVVKVFTLAIAMMLTSVVRADTVTVINFEGLTELTSVTNQFAGLTFSNATVLAAGSLLNEFEYPPNSGANVVFDDGGPMAIMFLTPVTSIGGFFTYSSQFTLQAFDASNNLLNSANSIFTANLALSGETGSTPNEFLQLSSATGISKVTITGDPFGGSFALDDLTITTSISVPEPGALLLLIGGLMFCITFRARWIEF